MFIMCHLSDKMHKRRKNNQDFLRAVMLLWFMVYFGDTSYKY